mgnify:FL=1
MAELLLHIVKTSYNRSCLVREYNKQSSPYKLREVKK